MFSFNQWLESEIEETVRLLKDKPAEQEHHASHLVTYSLGLTMLQRVKQAWEQSIEYRASLDALGDNIEDKQ